MIKHAVFAFFLLITFSGISQTLSQKDLSKRILDKQTAMQNYAIKKAENGSVKRINAVASIVAAMPEQDCNSAIPVCQNVYNTAASYSGVGSQDEIPGNTCLGEDEKNSVWYTFTSNTAGTLAFQISPSNLNDDYDFALYDITNNSCSGISSGAITPIRCNYAADAGSTGLSTTGVNASEDASGSNQSSVYPTLAGKTYVLIISNYSSTQSGYSLNFSSGTASIFDNTPPTISSVIAPCGSNILTLQASEQVKCSSIAANGSDFVVSGTGGPYTVTAAAGINCGANVSQLSFTISPALSGVGPWTVGIQTGTDGNSLIDACGNAMLPDTRTFTVSPPAASITGPTSVCKGTPFALTASNGSAYNWTGSLVSVSQQSLQTISITPTVSGTQNFQVVISYGSCGTATANTSVSVENAPIASFNPTPSYTVCQGSTVAFNNTSTSLSFPNFNVYDWSFGDPGSLASNFSTSSNPSHTYANPGTYNVVLTATPFLAIVGLGCSNTAVRTIQVLANNPTLTASPSTTICPGTSVTLSANGALTYTWSPPDGLSSTNSSTTIASPTVTTIYTITASGCVSSASKTVEVVVSNTPPVIGSIVGSATVCANVNNVSYSVNDFSNTTYSWSTSPNLTLTPTTNTTAVTAVNFGTSSGTITVSATNACGTSTNAILVSVTTLPLIINATPSAICAGSSSTLSVSGANSYNWQPSSNLSMPSGSVVVASPTTTTTYTVYATQGLCSSTATVQVTVILSPSFTLNANPSPICQGESSVLTATANGVSAYTWSNGGTQPQITVTPSSTTSYTVSGTNGCFGQGVISVIVNPKPSIIINAPSICANRSATLTASGANTYTWVGGSTSNPLVINPSGSSVYTITGTSLAGCVSTQTTLVTVNNPQASFAGMNNTKEGIETVLNLQNTSTGAGSILWNTCYSSALTAQTISLPLLDTGICCVTLYAFTATCVDSITKCVTVIPKTFLNVPNVFTPNGDGHNDVFTLTAINIGEINMSIYDRWGLKLFDAKTSGNIKWDGKTLNGALVPDGTYFYVLKAEGLDGKVYDLKGTINVFK